MRSGPSSPSDDPSFPPSSDRSSRRLTLIGLALGLGYAAQAGGYFGALERIDASLTSLLLYIYPALVFAGAVALGRERPDQRRVGALVLASGGVALVLAGGGAGALDGVGVALGLFAAVCSFAASGWLWIVALALISTVGAVTAFTLGLARVGPSTASIVSTIEPVVTVGLVMAVFGERLAPVQLAGGALVLAAVIALQLRGSFRVHVAPADLPAPAPARPTAQSAA